VAVADGLWLVRGADGPILRENGGAIATIAILATDAGAVLVDAGPSLRYGEQLAALARKLTGRKVARVYLTHLHPDHVYGSMAFAADIVATTSELRAGLARDGASFADGMYRLLGDWMRGSEFRLPGGLARPGDEVVGGRTLRLLALSGHSAADLAVLDVATGTLVAGDLVFHDRAPSTPHAVLADWRSALDTLGALDHRRVVPGHGPLDPTPGAAIAQTRDWLDWLEATLSEAVRTGRTMVEAGNTEIPQRFATMASARYELQRSVAHLMPVLEQQLWRRVDAR
jgi:quinoprotein relay system zinc metallohydrolase 1